MKKVAFLKTFITAIIVVSYTSNVFAMCKSCCDDEIEKTDTTNAAYSPNTELSTEQPAPRRSSRNAPTIHSVVKAGTCDDIRNYLRDNQHEIDAIINSKDSSERTAIHYAALRGNTEIMYNLLTNNADLTAQDAQGETPFHFAVSQAAIDPKKMPALIFLLDFARETNKLSVLKIQNKAGNNPLHTAILKNNATIVERILRYNQELVHNNDDKGQVPLFLAAVTHRNLDVTKALLEAGANPTHPGIRSNISPLEAAEGDPEILGLFKQYEQQKESLPHYQSDDDDE